MGNFSSKANNFNSEKSPTTAAINGKRLSFYDLKETDIDGQEINFESFKGKVVYGVNVASQCGYTESGYHLIKELGNVQGVQILLFPCNQFLNQEPGSNGEIKQFCMRKGINRRLIELFVTNGCVGVKGAITFSKGDVNGSHQRPTYQFLKAAGVVNRVSVRIHHFS